jgi:hypothetical protein
VAWELTRLKNPRNRTVRDEWLARLPAEKEALFRSSEARFESCYGILSVTLDEALSLRQQGDLGRACAEAGICNALYGNVVARLTEALAALQSHTRHYGTQPVVAPLEPDFFRGEASGRAAAWNTMLHHVLLSGRSRWFHKLQTLQEILACLGREFHDAASDLNQGTSIAPAQQWELLEALHDDLNTCLREMVIMLKCFLRALPGEQVQPFRGVLEPAEAKPAGLSSLARATS